MRGDSLVISGVVASIPGLRLTLDGELDGALGTAQLTIGAEGENLSVLGAQLPDIPFSATTELVGAEETLDFSPFAFTFGESEISGGLQVTGGDNPSINLTAASPLIDLRPFTSEEESEMESDEPPESEQGEYVFTEEPLPLDTLRDMRAEIDFTVDRLRLTSSDARNLKARATIEDGILNFENTFDGQRDGRFETGVQLAATGADEAELKITSKVRGLKTGILSGEGVPVDLIPATTIDIGLDAVGGTPRELASSLNGGVVVTQGPGRVRNDLIEKLSGDIVAQLFSALNPFARDEEFTDWDCTVFALDFDSGAGEITGFLLQSDKLMVVGGGGIDLNTEKLNIEFNTKPRAGVGISADMFVTPFVKLSGTLANPSVGLNAKGALLSGGAAVLTGGMSFLYQGLVDRATAEGGQCEQALESVRAPEANED